MGGERHYGGWCITERKFNATFTIEPVDLTLLAQAFAEQYEKQLAEQHLQREEAKAETKLAT